MQGGSTPSSLVRQSIAGPGSAAFKYDVLTALLVMAAQGNKVEARLALRLSLLMTARYSWRSGRFSVGLRELARMWGVTERTAKREMSSMRSLGWISVCIPAARGRVATYRIDLPVVVGATRRFWGDIGPDFVARMTGAPEPDAQTNVVPLRQTISALPETDDIGWSAAAAALREQAPSVYQAWFASLSVCDIDSGCLVLIAPTKFHADYVRSHHKSRLLASISKVNPGVRDIAFQTVADGKP